MTPQKVNNLKGAHKLACRFVFNAILLFTLFSVATPAISDNTGPIETDKAAHIGVAALATASSIRVIQLFNAQNKITWSNRLASSLLVTAAALAKEKVDMLSNANEKVDSGDLKADAVGVIYGNILMIEF
jgi:hypothetical protein